jgi:DNA modification methylase
MLGAITSGVKMYIGTEPSSETFDGLTRLAIDFGAPISTQLYRLGSEDFKPDKNSLDLCFTSPPYFDLEKYADEETQSYVKFNNKEAWVEGFLRPTFENCYYGLKSGKFMLINIADVKDKHDINLEFETMRVANEVGFETSGIHQLALSNINLRGKDKKFKYEPIFIFKKV